VPSFKISAARGKPTVGGSSDVLVATRRRMERRRAEFDRPSVRRAPGS
jgi:hypothetical protein